MILLASERRYSLKNSVNFETVQGRSEYCLIDLRTREEHNQYTIPGSYSLPILNYDERRDIGILYKKGQIQEAKILGLEYVGQRLAQLYIDTSSLLANYKKLVLFCSRGGFRSSTIFALFDSLGLPVMKLDGGYKKYRQFINTELPKLIESSTFIVLAGGTGVGKTEILAELKEAGEPVLDLEGLARHKGSFFGHLGEKAQPSQKMFDSKIYDLLWKNQGRRIFVEGESYRMGRLILPKELSLAFKKSQAVRILAQLENRIDRIERDYAGAPIEDLLKATSRLERYLGQRKVQDLKKKIQARDFQPVIKELITNYYDKTYGSLGKGAQEFYREDPELIKKLINLS